MERKRGRYQILFSYLCRHHAPFHNDSNSLPRKIAGTDSFKINSEKSICVVRQSNSISNELELASDYLQPFEASFCLDLVVV